MFKCIYCDGKDCALYKKIGEYTLNICTKCNLLTTNEYRYKRSEYIQQTYSKHYVNNYGFNIVMLNNRYSNYLKLICRYFKYGKFLDVGCGTGNFLKFLAEQSAFRPLIGIEPNNYLRKVARVISKVKIDAGKLNSIPYPDNYFDVVTCLDVLEHSKNINENIKELKRIIKPGGIILIQTPNYQSIMAAITGDKWDWWCLPDHVIHFSFQSLGNILHKSGFTILSGYTYEDTHDFLSNIKSKFTKNIFTKITFYLIIPILIIIEIFASRFKRGALSIYLIRK